MIVGFLADTNYHSGIFELNTMIDESDTVDLSFCFDYGIINSRFEFHIMITVLWV